MVKKAQKPPKTNKKHRSSRKSSQLVLAEKSFTQGFSIETEIEIVKRQLASLEGLLIAGNQSSEILTLIVESNKSLKLIENAVMKTKPQ